MPADTTLQIKLQIIGDSLTQALDVKPTGWYDGNLHKGPEQPGLGSLLTECSSIFSILFNARLARSNDLANHFDRLVVESNAYARSGLAFAHVNPTADKTKLPHQQALSPILNILKDCDFQRLLIIRKRAISVVRHAEFMPA